jgi:hypothetical protein
MYQLTKLAIHLCSNPKIGWPTYTDERGTPQRLFHYQRNWIEQIWINNTQSVDKWFCLGIVSDWIALKSVHFHFLEIISNIRDISPMAYAMVKSSVQMKQLDILNFEEVCMKMSRILEEI